jgi:hypothetical protein
LFHGSPLLGVALDGEELFVAALITVIVFLATSARRSPGRCPRCREINRDQARFCAQCGSRLLTR